MRDVIWTRSGSKTNCRPLCLHLLPTDLPVSQQPGDSDDVHDDGGDGAYLIIVTGTMGGARVKIFWQV